MAVKSLRDASVSFPVEKRLWSFFFFLVVMITVVDIGQDFLFSFGRQKEIYWPQMILFSSDWLLWLLLLPGVSWLLRRLNDLMIAKNLALWIGAGVVVCLGHLLIKSLVFYISWVALGNEALFFNVLLKMTETFHVTIITYSVITALLYITAKSRNNPHEPANPYRSTFPVKSKEGIMLLDVVEIYWLQANDNYVWLHCNHEKYLIDDSITNLEKVLDPAHFMRIHRSAIINTLKIKSVYLQADDPFVTLADGSRVKYSKTYKKRLMQKIDNSGTFGN